MRQESITDDRFVSSRPSCKCEGKRCATCKAIRIEEFVLDYMSDPPRGQDVRDVEELLEWFGVDLS